jgi:hypothetical protein
MIFSRFFCFKNREGVCFDLELEFDPYARDTAHGSRCCFAARSAMRVVIGRRNGAAGHIKDGNDSRGGIVLMDHGEMLSLLSWIWTENSRCGVGLAAHFF